jgi:hypothetical protein
MSSNNYCIEEDCKYIATSNFIEDKFTRCDIHKIDKIIFDKTLDYIKRFRNIHGNRYEYYKLLYVHNREKIKVTCKSHGDFLVRPDIHLAGHNCKKCSDSNRINKTTEQFIEDAKRVHGNKYDYSKVSYIRHDKDVIIICPTHGEFNQKPEYHLIKHGCNLCAIEINATKSRLTTDSFINKANEKHGDKYDYSKVEYTGWYNPVIIICNIHKEFSQVAGKHLTGSGCLKCGINKTKTQRKYLSKDTQYYINKFKEIHGDKYDYSLVNYTNLKTKITIICKEHGEFTQLPFCHLKGAGCPKCGIINSHKKQKKTQEDFIKECKEKHNDLYDYSKVNYTTCKNDITIICKEHGEFIQNATCHLSGRGCKSCRNDNMSKNRRFDLETVINNAREVHGNKYDYSLIKEYINNSSPLDIVCHAKYKNGATHGIFKQSYQCHVTMKSGCPRCSLNGFSKSQIEWLEFIMLNFNIKIINIKNDKEYKIDDTYKRADGFCRELNTIFEFDGCYYHGCPTCYKDREKYNQKCKKTFNELYNKTIQKEEFCKNKGYIYISIWECEWKSIKLDINKQHEYCNKLKNILQIS